MGEDESAIGGTVLVVEDNRELADLMAAWLRDLHVVEVAYSGEDALEILDSTFDVVLLDRRMPGMSGDEVLERIRERELGVAVVVVSAVHPDFDVIGMALDDYVTKPVERDEIRNVVQRTLTREHDESMIGLYRLVQMKKILDRNMTESELEHHDGYRRLVEQIAALREETGVDPGAFESDDGTSPFRGS